MMETKKVETDVRQTVKYKLVLVATTQLCLVSVLALQAIVLALNSSLKIKPQIH